jgi:hypothetical protein
MIHKAKDLSPDQRAAIEALLGRPLSEQEEISLRVLQPPQGISPSRRREILDGLKAHFARVDAQRKPVSPEEADEIINEALRSVRPGYRPIH